MTVFETTKELNKYHGEREVLVALPKTDDNEFQYVVKINDIMEVDETESGIPVIVIDTVSFTENKTEIAPSYVLEEAL
nr:MAG TPA: hypothetical protein [Caudoviricetes sp.]